MESIFQDDGLLLSGNPADTAEGLDRMQSLGATTIHALVPWAQIAPGREDVTRPAGFDATDPEAYPAGVWTRWDRLVREANARKLGSSSRRRRRSRVGRQVHVCRPTRVVHHLPQRAPSTGAS